MDYIRRILAKAQFTGNFQSEYPTALIHALLDDVPSEDVRPLVRGRWEWNDDLGYYNCSNCYSISPREDQAGEYCDCPDFCHVCGADMRGENEA